MVIYLILGAITIVAVAGLVLVWVQLDRRITGAEGTATAAFVYSDEGAQVI